MASSRDLGGVLGLVLGPHELRDVGLDLWVHPGGATLWLGPCDGC